LLPRTLIGEVEPWFLVLFGFGDIEFRLFLALIGEVHCLNDLFIGEGLLLMSIGFIGDLMGDFEKVEC